jgi:peptidoglycan/xylan/chitin deacetylase (PgdA/CDA1 family)
LKKLIYKMPGGPLVSRQFSYLNRKRPIVLAFHGVTSEKPGNICNHQGKHLYLPKFTEMMTYLRDNYSPVPLDRIVQWLAGGADLPDRAVAVTFDDGYRNVWTNAAPVLARLGIPATLYVVSEFVRDGVMVWTDRIISALSATAKDRLCVKRDGQTTELSIATDGEKIAADEALRSMCKTMPDIRRTEFVDEIIAELAVNERDMITAWRGHLPVGPEDLGKMHDQGITIGSHSRSHKIMSRCTPGQLRLELFESKAFIEEATGRSCLDFSYPNGGPEDFNPVTGEAVREAGYRSAVTTITRRVSREHSRFEIPRYTLANNETTLPEFASEMSGFPGFLRGIKRAMTFGR